MCGSPQGGLGHVWGPSADPVQQGVAHVSGAGRVRLLCQALCIPGGLSVPCIPQRYPPSWALRLGPAGQTVARQPLSNACSVSRAFPHHLPAKPCSASRGQSLGSSGAATGMLSSYSAGATSSGTMASCLLASSRACGRCPQPRPRARHSMISR